MKKSIVLLMVVVTLLGVFSAVIGQSSVFDTCWGKTRSEVKRLYPDFNCPQSNVACSLFDGDFTHAPNKLFFLSLYFENGSSYVNGIYVFIPYEIVSKAGWALTAENASLIADVILGDDRYYTIGFGDSREIFMIYPGTRIGCRVGDDDIFGYDVYCQKPYTRFDKLKNY